MDSATIEKGVGEGANWIGDATAEYLPADIQLRPLRDVMIVKPLPLPLNRAGALIRAAHRGKAVRGRVVFIGPAQRVKRYLLNAKGERCAVEETGRTIPCEVKVGDVVTLGGMELGGYAFREILIGLEAHIVCQEQDVCFVEEPDGPDEAA